MRLTNPFSDTNRNVLRSPAAAVASDGAGAATSGAAPPIASRTACAFVRSECGIWPWISAEMRACK